MTMSSDLGNSEAIRSRAYLGDSDRIIHTGGPVATAGHEFRCDRQMENLVEHVKLIQELAFNTQGKLSAAIWQYLGQWRPRLGISLSSVLKGLKHRGSFQDRKATYDFNTMTKILKQK